MDIGDLSDDRYPDPRDKNKSTRTAGPELEYDSDSENESDNAEEGSAAPDSPSGRSDQPSPNPNPLAPTVLALEQALNFERKEREKAQNDAWDAKAEAIKLAEDLSGAKREISKLQAELAESNGARQQQQDELESVKHDLAKQQEALNEVKRALEGLQKQDHSSEPAPTSESESAPEPTPEAQSQSDSSREGITRAQPQPTPHQETNTQHTPTITETIFRNPGISLVEPSTDAEPVKDEPVNTLPPLAAMAGGRNHRSAPPQPAANSPQTSSNQPHANANAGQTVPSFNLLSKSVGLAWRAAKALLRPVATLLRPIAKRPVLSLVVIPAATIAISAAVTDKDRRSVNEAAHNNQLWLDENVVKNLADNEQYTYAMKQDKYFRALVSHESFIPTWSYLDTREIPNDGIAVGAQAPKNPMTVVDAIRQSGSVVHFVNDPNEPLVTIEGRNVRVNYTFGAIKEATGITPTDGEQAMGIVAVAVTYGVNLNNQRQINHDPKAGKAMNPIAEIPGLREEIKESFNRGSGFLNQTFFSEAPRPEQPKGKPASHGMGKFVP